MPKTARPKAASKTENHDIIIIGAGPAGLAFAASLKDLDLNIALIEKNPVETLANPAEDGREIALTHTSIQIMTELGMMKHIGERNISPIKQAKVVDGTSPYALTFDSHEAKKDALGYLVSNHRIRQAAYNVARGQKGLQIITGVDVAEVKATATHSIVTLSDKRVLKAPLTVAADGRFSASRRMMGIPVASRDFGRTVIVCRLQHEKSHQQTAYECFHYGRTLAILPLAGNQSSAVITLSSKEAPVLLALSDKEFNADLTVRFGDHLGAIRVTGKRHAYPLIGTYPDRFYAERFALIGDAAVGMHPVTAHGYNFGLYGQNILAEAVREALTLGLDTGSPILLEKFSRKHRHATLPLYLGTNTLVSLFTDERPAMKIARRAVLRAGNVLLPFKKLVTHHLTSTVLAA
jgi:ubiquinone biosynthesis UbiH/UbiF/VisC/COQ6 family hydroxylase